MATLVSVLMSVRNEEPFLADAVTSLLEQTFSDLEIVLVDDASTDGTPQLIEAFARRDARIKPMRNVSRLGLTQSLNRALALASGSLIARLDGDDIAAIDRLERQVRLMALQPEVVLIGSGVALINADSATQCVFDEGLKPHEFRWTMLAHSPIVHSTAMFRAKSAKELGGYDSDFVFAQDFDLWRRLLSRGDGVRQPGVGAYHRVHERSVSAKHLDAQVRAIETIAFAALVEQPCLRAAVGDLCHYRAFLAALHGGQNLAPLAEKTKQMMHALVNAFGDCYGLQSPDRLALWRIAQTWLNAAISEPVVAVEEASDL